MNLKEAFRYQTFLNELVHHAAMSISDPAHCQTATRLHNATIATMKENNISMKQCFDF